MLQSLLGEDAFEVSNYGKSGRTMLEHSHCQPPKDYLANKDNVHNDSRYLEKHGASVDDDCSYWVTGLLEEVKRSLPHIFTIMLGTNDAKAFNWFLSSRNEDTIQPPRNAATSSSREEEYVHVYKEMIRQLQALPSKPHILLGVPPPLYPPYPYMMDI